MIKDAALAERDLTLRVSYPMAELLARSLMITYATEPMVCFLDPVEAEDRLMLSAFALDLAQGIGAISPKFDQDVFFVE